jgi:PAS domain S-box-containing protein
LEPLTTIPVEWLDQSHVVIYRLAGPLLELRPTFVSKNVLGLTGFSVEQSCTPSWWFDHLHPDDRDRLLARNRALSADRPLTDSYRFQTASGSYIWVRDERWLTGPPIDGVYEVVGTWTDISDLMEANRLLAEREQRARRWERVFDTAQFGLAHHDARTNTFLEVNPTFAKERGYTPEELVGRPVAMVYAPTEAARLPGVFAAVDQQRHLAFESVHQRKDGSRFPVLVEITTIFDPNDQPLSRVASTLDQLNRLATAIHQAGEAILLADLDGTITYVNPAFERATGYSAAEALGHNPRLLKSGLQDESTYQELWNTITDGRTWRGRLVNRRKDGSHFTEDASISPVFGADGAIAGFVAVKRDVTDRLRLEHEVSQKHKLEAVGTLAGGVAHDFNNMLSVILGNVELGLADPTQFGADQLMEIRQAAEHSARLTRQLLAFARKQTIAPRRLDLNAAVSDTLALVRGLVGDHIEVGWKPAAELWPVWMDPSQVEQILANLAVNARDAIGQRGSLTISTHNFELEAEIESQPGLEAGEYIVLTVEDDGRGMDQEACARAFEPFFSTRQPGGGVSSAGLGLATVYGIVRQNKGWIFVTSAIGRGTTFTLYFPRHQTDSGALPLQALSPAAAKSVLLVEDEPAMLKIVTRILAKAGYQVHATATPEEALRVAATTSSSIDLLLTDMLLPGISGPDLAAQLLAKHPKMAVVYMSGHSRETIAARGLKAPTHFLHKPFSATELAGTLRDALRHPIGGSPSG